MRIVCLLALVCLIAPIEASAAPIKLTPGLWEFTDVLRNFEISGDGKKEIDNGGSGPNVESVCETKDFLDINSVYPGLKRQSKFGCKISTISEMSNLIDAVSECTGEVAMVEHVLVIAPTSKSITIIRETTFTEPLYNGGISRSTWNIHAKWLKKSCDHH